MVWSSGESGHFERVGPFYEAQALSYYRRRLWESQIREFPPPTPCSGFAIIGLAYRGFHPKLAPSVEAGRYSMSPVFARS